MTKPDDVVEMDAMDVAEWEHGQHTPLASSAKLAELVKETARAPEPAATKTDKPPVRKTATVARAETANSGLARATPIPSAKGTSSLPSEKAAPKLAAPAATAAPAPAPAPAPKTLARTAPRLPPKPLAKSPTATSELTPVPEYPRATGTAAHTPLPKGLVAAHPSPYPRQPTPVPQEHVIVAAPYSAPQAVPEQAPVVVVEESVPMRMMPTPAPQSMLEPLPQLQPSPLPFPPPQLQPEPQPQLQSAPAPMPMPDYAGDYAEQSRRTDSLPALAARRSRRGFVIAGSAAAAIAIVVIAIVALSGHDDAIDRAPVVAAATAPAPAAAKPTPTPTALAPQAAAAAIPAPAAAETVAALAPPSATEPALAQPAPAPAKRVYKPAKPAKKKLVLDYDHSAEQAKLPSASDDAALASARSAYATGNQHLFSGDTASAIASYRQALAAYPGYVAGYRGLGLAYTQQGDKPKALDALRTYVKSVPNAKDISLIKKRIARLSAP